MRRHVSFAAERTSTNAVTWWFAPAGGFVTALIMWSLGVPMTFSHWLPDNGVVRAAFDVLVCVLLAYGLIFIFWVALSVLRRWRRVHFEPALVVAAVGMLVLIGGLSYYFWDRSRGPIIWTWSTNSPIAGSMSSSDLTLWIDAFNVSGRNRSDDVVTPKRAFVRSDVDGRTIELMALNMGTPLPLNSIVISGQQSFFLIYQFPSTTPLRSSGISVGQFREQFAKFTFTFEYEGDAFIKKFTESEVDALLAASDAANKDALRKSKEMLPFGGGLRPRP